MIRKIATVVIGLFALSSLLLAVAPSPDANAQDSQCEVRDPDYNVLVTATGCLVYPVGGFTPKSTPVPTATPGPTSSAVVSADTAAATTGGGAGAASIAFTGAESRVLGYAGAGLIGLGAIALVVARRQSDSELD